MRKGIFLFFILFLIVGLFPVGSKPALGAGATLFLSPGSGSYMVGKNFTIKVMVNSGGGVGINASEGALKFDTSYLRVVNITESGSIFELWTTKPSYSNTNGTIGYGGGLPSAHKGSAGTLFTIIFTAKKVGTTNVNFTSGVVLAADGKGTNIFSGFGNGSYTIKEAEKEPEKKRPDRPEKKKEEPAVKGILPPAPEVYSETHPKEDVWYASNDPQFSWKMLSDITGVSILISDSDTSDPGPKSDGIIDLKTFTDTKDGEWYFHIKYLNRIGWGKITHRKFLIDVTPPSLSGVAMDNGGDPTNPTPLLRFTASDKMSGIGKYQITRNGEVKKIEPEEIASNYYKFELLNPGEHRINFIVFDKADNAASSSLSYIVEALKPPIITDIPRTITKQDELVIRGTSFYPNVTVNLYIGQEGEGEALGQVQTDNEGNWNYFHKSPMKRGVYEIWAKIVDERGAQSMNSTKHVLTVISPAIIEAYGWLIILILIIIIILETLYIIYLKRKFREEKERIKKETDEVKKRLEEVFTALHEEVDELMEMADKRQGLSESERRVKEKLQEALNISQEFLGKEIDDVDKEIKLPPEKK